VLSCCLGWDLFSALCSVSAEQALRMLTLSAAWSCPFRTCSPRPIATHQRQGIEHAVAPPCPSLESASQFGSQLGSRRVVSRVVRSSVKQPVVQSALQPQQLTALSKRAGDWRHTHQPAKPRIQVRPISRRL
jgi:hypothetical protein